MSTTEQQLDEQAAQIAAGEATGPAFEAIRRAVADHERANAASVTGRGEMASTNDASGSRARSRRMREG